MIAVPKDRPFRGNYRVFDIFDNSVSLACIVTVYDDGTRFFEFDSDRMYKPDELAEILRIGATLNASEPVTTQQEK